MTAHYDEAAIATNHRPGCFDPGLTLRPNIDALQEIHGIAALELSGEP
jgi:hypothetical protein